MQPTSSAQSRDDSLGEARFIDLHPTRPAVERRAVLRYAVELNVGVNSNHNFYEGLVRDMGVAGVFVATHRRHAIGEWLELCIGLPDGQEPVRAIGEVRWVREYSGEGGAEPGMGIMFRTVSAAHLARIAAFLSCREPLLYDD